ncbi:MAG TPA: RES domain-containing protein [Acetobacteraceae bacterium]|jgi:RES domain-containing protein
MRVVRLGTDAYPIWDGGGAAARGGRWNPAGIPAIYAAGSLSLAMLEFLVQSRDLDRTFLVDADIPDDVTIDDLTEHPPPNWRALDSPAALRAGRDWLVSRRTAVLRVPSALVPREQNFVINPGHPDASRIHPTGPVPLDWDPRLFRPRTLR